MKTAIAPLVAALAVAAAATAGGAGANGSPFSPGLVHGWDGVLARSGDVRYVTLDTPRFTAVAALRVRDGRVLRSRALRGSYGVPLVAYDGTAGGLSGDGTRLVLASYGPPPGGPGTTRFVVLSASTLGLRRLIVLDGSWSFDAIAPDGSTLYLTEHVSAGRNPVYRVRTFDVPTGILRGAIVDRLEGEEEMGGEPVTRASSADGRWAYTLYARRQDEPFVHALDTARREAFCIDLPLRLGYDAQWALRLKLDEPSEALSVRLRRGTLATIDTGSWKVERGTS
ncbi:MAG: hypothetical protein ACRDNY_05145 [Gaiellaceae bacterium]